MQYNQKRARKFSKRAYLWIFQPNFSKFKAFIMLHPPKVFSREKGISFLKKALHEDNAHNNWLKYALTAIFF